MEQVRGTGGGSHLTKAEYNSYTNTNHLMSSGQMDNLTFMAAVSVLFKCLLATFCLSSLH